MIKYDFDAILGCIMIGYGAYNLSLDKHISLILLDWCCVAVGYALLFIKFSR